MSLGQPVNYFRTSRDVIAFFIPSDIALSSLPVLLSTGLGKEEFILYSKITDNVTRKPSMNGKIVGSVNNAIITGQLNYHPQSVALSPLRDISQKQIKDRINKSGTLYVLYPNSLIAYTLNNCTFTSIVNPPENKRTLGDVKVNFTSAPPLQISVGGVIQLVRSIF